MLGVKDGGSTGIGALRTRPGRGGALKTQTAQDSKGVVKELKKKQSITSKHWRRSGGEAEGGGLSEEPRISQGLNLKGC